MFAIYCNELVPSQVVLVLVVLVIVVAVVAVVAAALVVLVEVVCAIDHSLVPARTSITAIDY